MENLDAANPGNGGNNTPADDGQQEAPKWTAQLEADLQKNERLTQFENISEMGKALLNTEGKLENALFMPGEDATDEDRASFYSKLGVPETADKYQLDKPEGIPDEYFDEQAAEGFKQLAHENKLSETQAKQLHDWYWGKVKEGHEQQAQATEKAINDLKSEWSGDAFKENTELAHRAFKEFGGEEAQEFIEKSVVDGVALGNHPMFLKLFAAIGKEVGGDRIGGDRDHSLDAIQSDEEQAKARFPNTKF